MDRLPAAGRATRRERAAAQQKIAHTVDCMKQRLNQSLHPDASAALARLSRSRYMGLFKQRAGCAPTDHFIRLRMHHACQLLDTTDASLKALATEL